MNRPKPYRWQTPAGERTAELVELIRLACDGLRWDEIADVFFPGSQYGVRKTCDAFSRYASGFERTVRTNAIAARKVKRRRGQQNGLSMLSGVLEPALRREAADPWAGMGACFR